MLETIKVSYDSTNKAIVANRKLREIAKHSMIACDFEVAVKYSQDELDRFKEITEDPKITYLGRKRALAKLKATALDHASHCTITHLSIAWSDRDSYVFILDNPEITNRVLAFLTTTTQLQIWQNASYDFRHIIYRTGLVPKNYTDTAIYAKTLVNHVDIQKATVGLKELAGHVYGAWGISEDNFTIEQMYEEHMLKYAATDACATYWIFERLVENEAGDCDTPTTMSNHRPWELLPAPEPKTVDYPDPYFYHNVAKFLVKDTVKLMSNGLHIDLEKVMELEKTIDDILDTVAANIASNPLVIEFLEHYHKAKVEEYRELKKSKLKTFEHFIKPFKYSNMVDRSYFMHIFATSVGVKEPSETLPTGIPKWPVKTVKKLQGKYPLLKKLVEGALSDSHPIVAKAAKAIATDKAKMYNEKYLAQIKDPDVAMPVFNPKSSKDLQGFFAYYGIESDVISKKTGLPSWSREQVIRVNKETSDKDIEHFTQQLIDNSYAAIIKSNFIKAFYRYTVGDRLYGQYKLLGAKSGRYTSSNPNMLNSPSTKSIFAKPVKRCFTAPMGHVIATIDFAALEDRVMANLSRDESKLALFLDNLDGHSLSATFYYPDKVKEIVGDSISNKEASIKLKSMVDAGNIEAGAVRQAAKPISFGLAYGAFPPKVAASAKIPLKEAEEIFDAYHNKMYPGITRYREDYVLQTAKANGRIHLGLGFYIYTDSPEKDIRTLNNATCQFWSILTAIAINELHHRMEEQGLDDYIKVTSTIYDSIYFEVVDDAEVIDWLNKNIVEIMVKDFMQGQIIPNEADLEIGPSWAELTALSNDATIEDIEKVLQDIKTA